MMFSYYRLCYIVIIYIVVSHFLFYNTFSLLLFFFCLFHEMCLLYTLVIEIHVCRVEKYALSLASEQIVMFRGMFVLS